MSDTPLSELDDAIHRFVEATGRAGVAVSGWALSFSTSRIEPDDQFLPLVTGAGYALGPQTSTTDAAGLARFLSIVVEKHLLDSVEYDDE